MASNPQQNGRGQLPAITEDTVKELLAVQRQELQIRMEEVRRDTAEIAHNQSIAKQSIEAQERDRKHDREEITKRQKSQQWFVFAVVVALLMFSGYAVHVGQGALVLDIIKVLLGFAGGVGFQAYREAKRREEQAE